MNPNLQEQIRRALQHPLNVELEKLLQREPPPNLVTLRSLYPVPVLLLAWYAAETSHERITVVELAQYPVWVTKLVHLHLDESQIATISLNDAAATILGVLTERESNEYTNLFRIYP